MKNSQKTVIYVLIFQLEMNVRPSYRQSRSLDNIGENSMTMDPWYRNNHLIFINENMALATNESSSSNNEIIERFVCYFCTVFCK